MPIAECLAAELIILTVELWANAFEDGVKILVYGPRATNAHTIIIIVWFDFTGA